MVLKVRLDEVVPPQMIEKHRQHIVDFLLQEGITTDTEDLGATEMSERQVKELLEELADESDQM